MVHTALAIRAALAMVLLSASGIAAAADPAPTGYKHMGVGTCASSVCHNKLTAQTDRGVALNEVPIWSKCDKHALALGHLSNSRSQSMAAKLGLPSAATSKMCLDCHADNVPASVRGPKFQLTDGVQCEACHGGAEKWLETHTQKSASHADNEARGMYPIEQPLRRAELCLSCHMGTRDKFATHVIMGDSRTGSPRLQQRDVVWAAVSCILAGNWG